MYEWFPVPRLFQSSPRHSAGRIGRGPSEEAEGLGKRLTHRDVEPMAVVSG